MPSNTPGTSLKRVTKVTAYKALAFATNGLLHVLVFQRFYDLHRTRDWRPDETWHIAYFLMCAVAFLVLIHVFRVGRLYSRFTGVLLSLYPLFIIGRYIHWAVNELKNTAA